MRFLYRAHPRAGQSARSLALQALLTLSLCTVAGAATARDHRQDRRTAAPPPPLYMDECGSCHVAFPAQALPAVSWARIMGGLRSHFGTDASMDPRAAQALGAWLKAQASAKDMPPPDDRLTRTRWFLRKHHEIAASTWQRAAIRSPGNCSACHPQAAQGDFDEHAVRIPR